MSKEILSCAIDRWTAIWGDPVLAGTVFMLVYALAGLLALGVARAQTPPDRGYWRLCGWLLLFEVANTHLDLHAFPGSLARCMAHAQGWYAQRAVVQMVAIVLVVLVLCLLLLWIVRRYRAAMWSNALLTGGMVLSLGFTILRGANLHRLESVFRHRLGIVSLSDIIEMTGVFLVICAAVIEIYFWYDPAGRAGSSKPPPQSPPDTRRFT